MKHEEELIFRRIACLTRTTICLFIALGLLALLITTPAIARNTKLVVGKACINGVSDCLVGKHPHKKCIFNWN